MYCMIACVNAGLRGHAATFYWQYVKLESYVLKLHCQVIWNLSIYFVEQKLSFLAPNMI